MSQIKLKEKEHREDTGGTLQIRTSFWEGWYLSRDLDVGTEWAIQRSGRWSFQVEGTANVKSLRQEYAWHIWGTTRSWCDWSRMSRGESDRWGQITPGPHRVRPCKTEKGSWILFLVQWETQWSILNRRVVWFVTWLRAELPSNPGSPVHQLCNFRLII